MTEIIDTANMISWPAAFAIVGCAWAFVYMVVKG